MVDFNPAIEGDDVAIEGESMTDSTTETLVLIDDNFTSNPANDPDWTISTSSGASYSYDSGGNRVRFVSQDNENWGMEQFGFSPYSYFYYNIEIDVTNQYNEGHSSRGVISSDDGNGLDRYISTIDSNGPTNMQKTVNGTTTDSVSSSNRGTGNYTLELWAGPNNMRCDINGGTEFTLTNTDPTAIQPTGFGCTGRQGDVYIYSIYYETQNFKYSELP